MSTVTAQEVAELLGRAIRGEVSIALAGDNACTWDEVYCGSVAFMIGDWRVVFFNDCDELDYVEFVQAPDGRTADYETLDPDALQLLPWEEVAVLENLLVGAR